MTTATVPTANASRYLQQLCKHWSHKFQTEFSPERGYVLLPSGRLEMQATPDALIVSLTPADGVDLQRFQSVVAEHLNRFAFREGPFNFNWAA